MLKAKDMEFRFKADSFLDVSPITKIIAFIVSSVVMLKVRLLSAELLIGILASLFLLNAKSWRNFWRFTIIFTGSIIFEIAADITHITEKFLPAIVIFNIMRIFLPTVVLYYILAEKTAASEYLADFKKLRIPDAFSVSFVVMLRFIPTLREQLKNIKKALVFRNIKIGPVYFIKHPVISIERLVVPMLISSGKVMEELAAAAMTRGLDVDRKRTTIVESKINFSDMSIIASMAAILVLLKGGFLW